MQQGVEEPLGGHILAGIRAIVVSPYLAGICGYLLLLTTSATFLYLEQAQVIGRLIASPAERTRLYAGVDFTVSVLTFLTQIFVTNRLSLSAALLVLPAASLVGFALLGISQTVGVFVALIIARRVSEYALAKPGREVLFTRVNREEKYKAKNFIDTAISRGGDAASGWLVAGAKSAGATTAGLIYMFAPALLLWCWLAWWLAKQAGGTRMSAPHQT
jgi:AAA family ATP:ADP antiporter